VKLITCADWMGEWHVVQARLAQVKLRKWELASHQTHKHKRLLRGSLAWAPALHLNTPALTM